LWTYRAIVDIIEQPDTYSLKNVSAHSSVWNYAWIT
jgi:hypothetical protein